MMSERLEMLFEAGSEMFVFSLAGAFIVYCMIWRYFCVQRYMNYNKKQKKFP